ncbi:MAG: hypothetical protein ABIJ21_06730 [Nanoarchaeota archaeon]
MKYVLFFGSIFVVAFLISACSNTGQASQAVRAPGGGGGGYDSTCFDSDGGQNYQVYGNVSGRLYNGTFYNYPDFCLNNGFLNEWFCTGNSPNSTQQNCSQLNSSWTCMGGRCR